MTSTHQPENTEYQNIEFSGRTVAILEDRYSESGRPRKCTCVRAYGHVYVPVPWVRSLDTLPVGRVQSLVQ